MSCTRALSQANAPRSCHLSLLPMVRCATCSVNSKRVRLSPHKSPKTWTVAICVLLLSAHRMLSMTSRHTSIVQAVSVTMRQSSAALANSDTSALFWCGAVRCTAGCSGGIKLCDPCMRGLYLSLLARTHARVLGVSSLRPYLPLSHPPFPSGLRCLARHFQTSIICSYIF